MCHPSSFDIFIHMGGSRQSAHSMRCVSKARIQQQVIVSPCVQVGEKHGFGGNVAEKSLAGGGGGGPPWSGVWWLRHHCGPDPIHQDSNVKLCPVPRPTPAPAVYQEDCPQRSEKYLQSQMW
jgi:hypothetical protein